MDTSSKSDVSSRASTTNTEQQQQPAQRALNIESNAQNNDASTASRTFPIPIGKVTSYRIPDRESAKAKDGFQCGYLITWLFALLLSPAVVIGDWAIVKLMKVNICDIPDNYDSSNLNVEFFSFNSFAGLVQQIWLIIFGLGAFGMWYLPQAAGIDESNPKLLRHSRITLFTMMSSLQVIVNIFLVPIYYNFRSLFNAVSLILLLLWAYFYRKTDGLRRIYPLVMTAFMTVILYYIAGMVVLSNLPSSVYAIVYPLWLTFAQFVLLRLIEMLDVCQCCKSKQRNSNTESQKQQQEQQEQEAQSPSPVTASTETQEATMSDIIDIEVEMNTSCCTPCCDVIHRWKDTAPTNEWPDHYLYFMCSMIVVMAESFRLCSYVILAKESTTDLVVSLVISVLTECFMRNLIWKIIWEKYIRRNKVCRPLSLAVSVYLGCKFHTDYIPVLLIIACNVLKFGHNNDCYYSKVSFSMDISDGYQYLIPVFFGYEMVTDFLTFLIYKALKRCNLMLYDTHHRPLKMSFIVLTRTQICLMAISLGYWSFVAFIYDDSSRPYSSL